MDGFEFLIFIFSGYYSLNSIFRWYRRLGSMWPSGQYKTLKLTFGFLPAVSYAMILYTLKVLASFDVVGAFIYILFYIFLGFAWIFAGLYLVFMSFDLSWIDDAVENKNKAAMFAVTGAFLGLTIIYSGANVGDGPGWWCVLFAGGLGLIAWILLGILMNKFTGIFERISVERDIYCGIRFGCYLLASGIILGRASAGDWTSFSVTIVEFLVGWPVLPLTVLAIFIERFYINSAKSRERINNNYLLSSIYWGIIYVIIAVLCVMMFPLVENPAYDNLPVGLSEVVL
ncbi:MAG TPA: hypothetical protein GXX26_06430 [Clostridiaceae bacterium]|nr:hypothetical protein [Clostridiaceae bacterium]